MLNQIKFMVTGSEVTLHVRPHDQMIMMVNIIYHNDNVSTPFLVKQHERIQEYLIAEGFMNHGECAFFYCDTGKVA